MINVGIIGGAGYTAGELLRILIHHPEVKIQFVNSSSNAGNPLYKVHSGLFGLTDICFTDQMPFDQIDVLFFCTAHGDTRKFMQSNTLPKDLRIIDLSTDYRMKADDHKFVYGLPELNGDQIAQAQFIANPGCFATAIQLGLLPLAAMQELNSEVHINAITGSTGAGQKPTETSHFSWRNDNISIYKPFTHQHLGEIGQSLKQLYPETSAELNFIPVRGNFARGIYVTLYTESDMTQEEAVKLYQAYYENHPFVHVAEFNPDLKQVVGTNNCMLHIEKHGNKLLIISMIDNLLKGASGQAVHNMNLMFGLDPKCGLKLKPIGF